MNKEMKIGGQVLHLLLNEVEDIIIPGTTTKDIDDWIEYAIHSYCPEIRLACKNFHGFPASSCISVNEEIIHGVPGEKMIKEGDLVTVDVVLEYKGWFVDSARTYICGKAKEEDKRLVKTCRECLYKGISVARRGYTTGDIGYEIQTLAESRGYSVMREYSGHGIGTEIHMHPAVFCYGKKRKGIKLLAGQYLCIEPMLFAGSAEIVKCDDRWGVKSKDNRMTAHFEHTILINRRGMPTIIT